MVLTEKSMRGVCKTIGTILGILGAIASVWAAWKWGEVLVRDGLYGYDYERSIPLTIGIFVGGLVMTFVSVVIFYAIDEILEQIYALKYKLDKSLIQEMGMESVSKLQKESHIYGNKLIQSKGGWICPKCGKENANYVGTCGCGQSK